MLPVEQPFKNYTDLEGKPLDGGFVYFGTPDDNPITAPVAVYWDAEGTLPALQPLRTIDGYICRAGTPANVFCDEEYSMLVQDKRGQQVFYARTSEEFSIAGTVRSLVNGLGNGGGSSLVGFEQAGVGAIKRQIEAKLRESVSIADFGAKLDGATDDSDAIEDAINYAFSIGGGKVNLGRGVAGISRTVKLLRGVVLVGEGGFDYSAYPTIKGSVLKPLPGYDDPEVVLADSGNDNTGIMSGIGLADFAIDMGNVSALGLRAVAIRSASNFGPLRNIVVYNMDHGIGLELDQTGVSPGPNACDGVDVVNFFTYGKTVGYVSTLPRLQLTNNVNEINLRGCKWQSKSNAAAGTLAVRIYSGARGITFDGSSFAGCETGVVIYANLASTSPPEWVRFFNNTFEAYRVGIYVDSDSANPVFYPRRIHVDRSNRFITATGANCRKVYASRVNDCYFSTDDWIEASTSGTASALVELTSEAIGCVVEASPDQVINNSTTSIVFGRKGSGLLAKLYVEPVAAADLVNSWVNASPATRTSAGYWKDASNVARVQGYISGGTPGSGDGNAAFTLPAGYRPEQNMLFVVPTDPAGFGVVLIATDGRVYPLNGTGVFALDGISFRTA